MSGSSFQENTVNADRDYVERCGVNPMEYGEFDDEKPYQV